MDKNEKLKALEMLLASDDSEAIKALEQRVDALAIGVNALQERLPREIVIKNGNKTLKKMSGTFHKQFDDLLKIVSMNCNVLLFGSAGAGKSTVASQVAEALGLKFYSISISDQTTASNIVGYCGVTGEYVSTPVREAYEKGGLLLIDEFDAGNSNILCLLNGVIENKTMSFPDGSNESVPMHEDFRVICTANTIGKGADRQYVGRNALDGATLDRLANFEFEVDEVLETAICGNKEWSWRVQYYRKQVEKMGVNMLITPRASIMGAKLLSAGFSRKQVESMVVFKGADDGLVRKIKNGVEAHLDDKRDKEKASVDTTNLNVEPVVDEPQFETVDGYIEYTLKDGSCPQGIAVDSKVAVKYDNGASDETEAMFIQWDKVRCYKLVS